MLVLVVLALLVACVGVGVSTSIRPGSTIFLKQRAKNSMTACCQNVNSTPATSPLACNGYDITACSRPPLTTAVVPSGADHKHGVLCHAFQEYQLNPGAHPPEGPECDVCGEWRTAYHVPHNVPTGHFSQINKADGVALLQHWLQHVQALATGDQQHPSASWDTNLKRVQDRLQQTAQQLMDLLQAALAAAAEQNTRGRSRTASAGTGNAGPDPGADGSAVGLVSVLLLTPMTHLQRLKIQQWREATLQGNTTNQNTLLRAK